MIMFVLKAFTNITWFIALLYKVHSEKATKFCEIFTLLLSYIVLVKIYILRMYELYYISL